MAEALFCLVVDDEPIARRIVEGYISRTGFLELAGSLDNAVDVFTWLAEHPVDVMFLDINMPELTGLELLGSLNNPPGVILTTAYSEYGAASYDFDVIDYLLKPIPFDRFLKAAQKAALRTKRQAPSQTGEKTSTASIMLKADGVLHRLAIDEIIYVEALGNYLKVHLTEGKSLLVRKTVAEMERECSPTLVRIHKSFLVNPISIQKLETGIATLKNGQEISVGRAYKKALEGRF